MRRRWLVALGLAATGAAAHAAQVVIPVFAFNLAGVGTNRWTSVIFLTNPSPVAATARYAGFLRGEIRLGTPCLGPILPVEVPPLSTVIWPALAVARDLGCPAYAVGGLVVDTEGDVVVTTRMVNDRGITMPGLELPLGVGQEIPGLPVDSLPAPGRAGMVAGLLWDPLACGSVRFDSYLYIANPGDADANVTLLHGGGGKALVLRLDGVTVTTPTVVTVGAGNWRRLHLEPGGAWPATCGAPLPFDLAYSSDAPVAVLGSVVDRTSQDPRTVLPVPLAE